MARIPSVQDYGGTPTPAASRPMPNIPAAGQGVQRAAQIVTDDANRGNAAGDLSRIVGSVADPIIAAENRMMARQDAVELSRDVGAYSEAASAKLRELQTEGDFSTPETVSAYKQFLEQEAAKVLGNHRGGQESRLKLAERMASLRTAQVDTAARLAFDTSTKLVTNRFSVAVNARSAGAAANPGSLPAQFAAIEQDIEDLAPALAPETEATFRMLARQQVTLSAVDGFLNRGDWKGAKGLIADNPGFQELLDPAAQRTLNGRIATFEREEAKAKTAGLRKVEELRQILGREPTVAERVRAAGVAGPQGTPTPAQKIADTESALGRPLTEDEKARVAGLATADLSDARGIRQEYVKASGDFVAVRDAFGRIEASSQNPSPAGDLALIFNYMKMLDPGSVVRESEFAQAASTGSYGQRIQGLVQRAISGERLTDEQRADFVSRAQDLMTVQNRNQRLLEAQFRGVAERAGINPADVTLDFGGDTETGGGGSGTVIQYDLQGNRIGGRK